MDVYGFGLAFSKKKRAMKKSGLLWVFIEVSVDP